MAQVITQIEMMRYQGAPLAVFPEGTILTPSAKDWAREQGIEVRIGGSDADTGQEFLDQVVGSVIRQYRSTGTGSSKIPMNVFQELLRVRFRVIIQQSTSYILPHL